MGPTDFFEESARACGFRSIAGIDEAGRGPLAGPVVAAAVILPRKGRLDGLDDSKRLTEDQRERLYDLITHRARAWAVGLATEREIDSTNILKAATLACFRAVRALSWRPDYLLLDAMPLLPLSLPQRAVIKGDRLSVSIAAASILAKVSRDRLMVEYHHRYPAYQFHRHKGYPTSEHLRLLAQLGPCEGHRLSFRPVQRSSSPGEPL